MNTKINVISFLLTLSATALHAQDIDNFNSGTGTTVITSNFFSGPTSTSAVGSATGILGTERDMEVTATGGMMDVTLDAGGVTGFLLLSAGSGATGIGQVVWDGPDGAPTTVDLAVSI